MKRIAVVLRCTDSERAAEALRAAVGLTLRGDRVLLVWAAALDRNAPVLGRALGTLAALGHDTDAPLAAIRASDAVEVWS